MSAQGSITQWLQAAEQGDEQAAQALWERYYTSLLRLARSRLGRRAGFAVDEQDVVLNAFDAFYRGFQSGRFPQINDRHDLWRLLITLTGRKAVDVVRREHRQKRGTGQVIAEADLQPGKDRDARPNLADFIGSEPSPEFALMLAEDLQRRIDNLPKEVLKQICVWKMEGWTNVEIAGHLDCTTRTVERKLELIRTHWQENGNAVGSDEE